MLKTAGELLSRAPSRRRSRRFGGEVAAVAGLLLVLFAGGALAADPPIHDCSEGAGYDLGSVSLDDLVHGPPPPPPASS